MVSCGALEYKRETVYRRLPEIEREESRKPTLPVRPTLNFTGYLDDFLRAVNILGGLDRSIFHELTKELKTVKLDRGETLEVNHHMGFYVVVEGEIITDTNDVRKGGTALSPFIALLSLFFKDPCNRVSVESVQANKISTVAIIPRESFMRIAEREPIATGHIVQVIMARLASVTFQTAHKYLGLTKEIYKPELNLCGDVRHKIVGLNKKALSKYMLESLGFEYAGDNVVELLFIAKESILVNQNDESNGIYVVLDGALDVGYYEKTGEYIHIHTVESGQIAGYFSTVFSHKSFVEIKAKTNVQVAYLPKIEAEKNYEKNPIKIAETLIGVVPEIIVELDKTLEWVQVNGGETVFSKGDEADAIYVVLNGRLRSEDMEEYSQGASIGEKEVLTAGTRPWALQAVRSSELAKVPRTLVDRLARKYPVVMIEISRLMLASKPARERRFKTVAVMGMVSVELFGDKLYTAFREIGQKVMKLDSETVLRHLGKHAFTKIGRLKLSRWLVELEEQYDAVLYVADSTAGSFWTERCILQADCILLLVNANSEPEINDFENVLLAKNTSAHTELVLLHEDRYVVPGSTAKWLKNRIWIDSHQHIQLTTRTNHTEKVNPPVGIESISGRFSRLKSRVRSTIRRPKELIYQPSLHPHKNDFARLARILSNKAIGLVLGGGGARGISHLGMLRALETYGIPIDFVGGTSIGSYIGGLYARDYDIVPVYGRAKQFSQILSSFWRRALDLTFPLTAFTTGHQFNMAVYKSFGDTQMEDFWLRYYAIATNLTHFRMEAHTAGYAWRYIRSSMSLAGLVPPLLDKGSMLVDGGYMDNLPVETMREMGARHIIAVDVGSVDDTTALHYGDTVSGLKSLFRWIYSVLTGQPRRSVPSLAEIQLRLTYVSSVATLERAKVAPGVMYCRPPIDQYATMDFAKFEEILNLGENYGLKVLKEWEESGKLKDFLSVGNNNDVRKMGRKMGRRNSI